MENETKVIESVSSKKGIIGKLAVVAAGIAAGVGAVIFIKRRKAKKAEETEVTEDSIEETK